MLSNYVEIYVERFLSIKKSILGNVKNPSCIHIDDRFLMECSRDHQTDRHLVIRRMSLFLCLFMAARSNNLRDFLGVVDEKKHR